MGKTLASIEEVMISVPEEGTTATTRCSSKTQVPRTATFFKEISQLIAIGQLLSAHQLIKKILLFKGSGSTISRKASALLGQLGKTDKRSEYFADSHGISNSIPLQTKAK